MTPPRSERADSRAAPSARKSDNQSAFERGVIGGEIILPAFADREFAVGWGITTCRWPPERLLSRRKHAFQGLTADNLVGAEGLEPPTSCV
jgi:hypothetical protein